MNEISNGEEVALKRLVFRVGREEFGVDIRKVREIRSFEMTTKIVDAQAYLKGVINLQGIVVPIVDLRFRFGYHAAPYNHQTAVIVMQLNGKTIGVIVDGVSEVASLTASQIKPAPQLYNREARMDYILGLWSVENRLVVLLDMERVLGAEELAALEAVAVLWWLDAGNITPSRSESATDEKWPAYRQKR